MNNNIYIGNSPLTIDHKEVSGSFVEIENEKFYKISNYDRMSDFFMIIVSNSNHWMFISSNGSLTAGRKDRDNAIFPYYTVDKIHDYKGKTGSKTICLITKNDKTYLWEPFTDQSAQIYNIECNIYKSIYGNKVIFEEINHDLKVGFKYGWYNSEKYGWIKKSEITNLDSSSVKINILDGIRNILPSGVDYAFQNEYSNLLDAYKKNEFLTDSKLGLYRLSSVPVDRAEPSESLKVTSVWSYSDIDDKTFLISDNQVDKFRMGHDLITEEDIRAARGAFYLNAKFDLNGDENQQWYLAAEVNQDATDITDLADFLTSSSNIAHELEADIKLGTDKLIHIVASADGIQIGKEPLIFARHFSNTLFNVMRGGIFTNNYTIDTNDLSQFIRQCNSTVYEQFKSFLNQLPKEISYIQLVEKAIETGNTDLLRISYEYLPLTFSRRHGDPSRPWNQFSIETKNSDGSPKHSYQGNWRDIFQNWEALSLSFPEYIESIICKFVNASTPDGYNPYRITREGIDWEVPDPHDPWSYIGYWGDHQIIYLQKFLEQSEAFHPGKLDEFLTKEIFVYANVPYQIKSFEEIIQDPQDTIAFNFELHDELEKVTSQIGSDGKLLRLKNGEIYNVNLLEKILATLLAKLSNFIPEAGIWLNTQRPEWNDANNALVGNGVSMVTLYYLRRFLELWQNKFSKTSMPEVLISNEMYRQFQDMHSFFNQNKENIKAGFSDSDRYTFASELGKIGSEYRNTIYKNGFSGKKTTLPADEFKAFISLALQYMEQSIAKNKRSDNLYHAYNLISIKDNSISIRFIDEMLEGQVAVLSSGMLSAKDSLTLLDALKASSLFRANQYSYILYPNKELPRFVEKNNISEEHIQNSQLLQELLRNGDSSIITQDKKGICHFNSAFRNAAILKAKLDELPENQYGELLQNEKKNILNIYEELFDHQSFTGRSGTFYGYEGLGSIYWHMVSKLLLAVQEVYIKGEQDNEDPIVLGKIKDHYYEIKAGIGLYKSPALYGAFPTDPYSHTPDNAGAKQPGLTGQVKEDVISRFGELGILIQNGAIEFKPSLLNHNEILDNQQQFKYIDINGIKKTIELNPNQLAFTFCQIPIVYNFGNEEKIVIEYTNGQMNEIQGCMLDHTISMKLFSRSGEIQKVEFYSKKLINELNN
jgi:hypothetical protein